MAVVSTMTITAIAEVTGSATGVPGTVPIPTVDYTAELKTLEEAVATITAKIVTLNSTLDSINFAIGSIATTVGLIEAFLITIQTPTGDFRVRDAVSTAGDALVSTALTKSGIIVPPNPGV